MSSCPRPVAAPAHGLAVRMYRAEPARAAVEAYIARRYARCHGARIDSFLPHLLSAEHDGGCVGALGLRPADTEPLFLEHYLDAPVEAAVAAAMRQPVERAQVVEIGNLATSSRRAGQVLITLLIEALRGAGFRWLVFTATRQVRALVQDLGFALDALAAADPTRLGGASAAWGRYYEAEPQVMAGDLAAGAAHIRRCAPLVALTQAHAPALARIGEALR
ncbi:thermostable hemolysin [Immundisolibacter sp.]|uniref:thermostable hemolysin n=1 Tax=Immundisolibacter sp. TaxID=1934948 RepID=UPI002636923A|nr:thermostable hemolysin [Immundisolibacter sp.]MDD3650888.1 thermostable hemolysin [Immundisolibacter sp.]